MTDRVVVTGIGLVTPIGLNSESTWNSLVAGRSGIDYISLFDAEGYESRIAGEVDNFDASAALGRKEARRLDRFSQFACVAALEALEHANLNMEKEDAIRLYLLDEILYNIDLQYLLLIGDETTIPPIINDQSIPSDDFA